MSHRTRLALVLAGALLSGGCGSINNINKPCVPPTDKPDASVCRIYGGLREDWGVFWHYPWAHTTAYADYVLIPLLAVANFCLDAAGDTLTLPYTAVEELRRTFGNPTPSLSYIPVQRAAPVGASAPPTPTLTPTGAAPQPGAVPAAVPRPAPGTPDVTSPR